MNSNPLVSVVIPTFRRPHLIDRAINSVLNQTYKNLEVIVVDDNAPDTIERKNTQIAISRYKNIDNVKYIKHEKNSGGSTARNTGWKNAQGKYIAFLDDDDEISPCRIEEQVKCLESLDDSWGACYTAYHILMENGYVQHSTTDQYGDVYIRALMRTFYIGGGSNLLIRKSVVDEIAGFDETFKRNQDIEFMARAFENYKVAYIPKDLLTIHWEVRNDKKTYEFADGITTFYLDKMSNRINRLSNYDKHRVLAVIALERARVALYYKKFRDIYTILKDNHVSVYEIIKYLFYLLNRVITKKSYGFYLS